MSSMSVARLIKPQNRIRPSADAYVARMQHDVDIFLNWLTTHSQKGYIGEFGWPAYDDAYAYARFAEALYERLIGGPDVWITSWLCSENWPNHFTAAYRGSNFAIGQTATALNTRTLVGRIVEQHKGDGRGINLGNSGENGMFGSTNDGDIQPWSNVREESGVTFGNGGTIVGPLGTDHYQGGNYCKQWNYGSEATFTYLGSRGVKLVRIPFRAERVYKTFNAALDATEVGRLHTMLGWADDNDIQIILDCHNFGIYYKDNGTQGVGKALGGAVFTDAIFTDMWHRIATEFDGDAALVGYGLMNEPVGASDWVATSAQAGLDGVRASGSTKCVTVSFPVWAHPEDATGSPFVTDSANNVRYEVHCYFDYETGKDSSYNLGGPAPRQYQGVYAVNLTDCKANGYSGTDSTPTPSTVGVSDSFHRPNTRAGTTVGATEDGSAAFWHTSRTMTGTGFYGDQNVDWQIVDEVVKNYAANNVAIYVKTGLSDCTVQCTFGTVGTNSAGLWVRGTDDGASAIAVDLGGIYKTIRNTSSIPSFTQLASWTSPGYVSGDTLKVILSGTSIIVKKVHSGVETTLGSATSSYNQTEKNHGLWCYALSSPPTTWDNFSVA